MARHQQLMQLIDLFQPKTIVEIGTWNGWNAVQMIKQAQRHHQKISYVGYDLFEDASEETDAVEFNVKKHCAIDAVLDMIQRKCPDADVNLIKGNTRDTLKKITADFVFIDGGHSVETIALDYAAVRDSGIIVMDDFYTAGDSSSWPDTDKVGCNQLVSGLSNIKVLPIKDRLKDGGWNQMVLVV